MAIAVALSANVEQLRSTAARAASQLWEIASQPRSQVGHVVLGIIRTVVLNVAVTATCAV